MLSILFILVFLLSYLYFFYGLVTLFPSSHQKPYLSYPRLEERHEVKNDTVFPSPHQKPYLSYPRLEEHHERRNDGSRQNGTWDLIVLPQKKKVVECRLVYTVKLNSDGSLARLKARWLPKGTLRFMVWIIRTPSCRLLTFVRILISLVAPHHWPLHQLDVNNTFLNSILDEDVSGRVRKGVQDEDVIVRIKTISKSLVWTIWTSREVL